MVGFLALRRGRILEIILVLKFKTDSDAEVDSRLDRIS